MGRIILVEIPEESDSEPSWPQGWLVFLPEEAKDRPSQLKHNRLGVAFIQFQEYQFLSPVIGLKGEQSVGRPDFLPLTMPLFFKHLLGRILGGPEGKSPIHAFSVLARGLKLRF